jgi:hypothetical protein
VYDRRSPAAASCKCSTGQLNSEQRARFSGCTWRNILDRQHLHNPQTQRILEARLRKAKRQDGTGEREELCDSNNSSSIDEKNAFDPN